MNKFESIEVGDSVYVKEVIGFKNWRTFRWGLVIAKKLKVEKVTKTQFTTQGGHRFKKSYGSGFGDCKYDKVYLDKNFPHCSDVLDENNDSQKIAAHKEKINLISKAYTFDTGSAVNLLNIKKVDNAVSVAEKIIELIELYKRFSSKSE